MKAVQNTIPAVSLEDGVVLKSIVQQEQVAKYLQPHRMELGCLWIITKGTARLSINLSEYSLPDFVNASPKISIRWCYFKK